MPKGFGGLLMPGLTPRAGTPTGVTSTQIGSTNPGQDLVNKIRSGNSNIKLK